MTFNLKKNIGLHTGQSEVEMRILQQLSKGPQTMPSALGYSAYPGYHFKRPQGAAFAVAKILNGMCEQKLIRRERRGYSISEEGMKKLAESEHTLTKPE